MALGSRISHHGQTPGPQGSRVQVDQIRGSQSDGQKFLQPQGGYSLQDSPQVAVRAGKGQPADQDQGLWNSRDSAAGTPPLHCGFICPSRVKNYECNSKLYARRFLAWRLFLTFSMGS